MFFEEAVDIKYNNFLFIGEAGSGKSEIALNVAVCLKKYSAKQVHFFDLDMTKPLFRSRDIKEQIEGLGIFFHYEEQFMDAPTLAGGVRKFLMDPECITVIDVGGDYIGARSLGGFAPVINQDQTMVCYVVNSYRPWSRDIGHIDRVLGEILGVSHIELERIRLISNPNLGRQTEALDVVMGNEAAVRQITPYSKITLLCTEEKLVPEVKENTSIPVMPLHLYLTYPWDQEAV